MVIRPQKIKIKQKQKVFISGDVLKSYRGTEETKNSEVPFDVGPLWTRIRVVKEGSKVCLSTTSRGTLSSERDLPHQDRRKGL